MRFLEIIVINNNNMSTYIANDNTLVKSLHKKIDIVYKSLTKATCKRLKYRLNKYLIRPMNT